MKIAKKKNVRKPAPPSTDGLLDEVKAMLREYPELHKVAADELFGVSARRRSRQHPVSAFEKMDKDGSVLFAHELARRPGPAATKLEESVRPAAGLYRAISSLLIAARELAGFHCGPASTDSHVAEAGAAALSAFEAVGRLESECVEPAPTTTDDACSWSRVIRDELAVMYRACRSIARVAETADAEEARMVRRLSREVATVFAVASADLDDLVDMQTRAGSPSAQAS